MIFYEKNLFCLSVEQRIILVLPEPFAPFDNENNLPIIKVPSKFFLTKDFEKINAYIDDYFKENDAK